MLASILREHGDAHSCAVARATTGLARRRRLPHGYARRSKRALRRLRAQTPCLSVVLPPPLLARGLDTEERGLARRTPARLARVSGHDTQLYTRCQHGHRRTGAALPGWATSMKAFFCTTSPPQPDHYRNLQISQIAVRYVCGASRLDFGPCLR